MQAQIEVRDAQEHFEELRLSSTYHDNISCSDTVDCVQLKLEARSHRRSSEQIDVDEEMAKLILYLVHRPPVHAALSSVPRQRAVNMPTKVLPPPVRFSRADRKAIAIREADVISSVE
jgi:hypothetical protein